MEGDAGASRLNPPPMPMFRRLRRRRTKIEQEPAVAADQAGPEVTAEDSPESEDGTDQTSPEVTAEDSAASDAEADGEAAATDEADATEAATDDAPKRPPRIRKNRKPMRTRMSSAVRRVWVAGGWPASPRRSSWWPAPSGPAATSRCAPTTKAKRWRAMTPRRSRRR